MNIHAHILNVLHTSLPMTTDRLPQKGAPRHKQAMRRLFLFSSSSSPSSQSQLHKQQQLQQQQHIPLLSISNPLQTHTNINRRRCLRWHYFAFTLLVGASLSFFLLRQPSLHLRLLSISSSPRLPAQEIRYTDDKKYIPDWEYILAPPPMEKQTIYVDMKKHNIKRSIDVKGIILTTGKALVSQSHLPGVSRSMRGIDFYTWKY